MALPAPQQIILRSISEQDDGESRGQGPDLPAKGTESAATYFRKLPASTAKGLSITPMRLRKRLLVE
jgi:hypothetical protein